MEQIADIFANNPKVALVVIISLRDRSVLLKESRQSSTGHLGPLPLAAVVDTYLNIITTAALAFDIEANTTAGATGVSDTHSATTTASGVSIPTLNTGSPQKGPQVDESIQEEAWGLLRFRTRQWDIAAFRQDNADVFVENDNKGHNAGNPDQWMMVTFSEPSDILGTTTGNMTSRGALTARTAR